MIRLVHVLVLVFVAVTGLMSLSASAQTPDDVLDRVCTPQEKGDMLAYLLSVKK